MPARVDEPVVLMVDDDRGLLRLMERALRSAGIQTASAGSGKEAREWLLTRRPRLMLCDLKLPDTGGMELIQQLESNGLGCPFLVITGQGDERVAVEMMKLGALDYLVKDGQFYDLIPTRVTRALERVETEKRLRGAEAASRAQLESTRVIAEGGPAGLALQKLLAVLGERLGWSRVEFWEFDRATRTVRPAQSWGTARGGTSWGRKARACAAATDPEPVWHEEIPRGGSLVVFPVLCSTEVAGVVLLNSAGRRAVDGDLMALFRILGGQLGQFFERTRLEKEVMEITQREQRRIGQDLHDGLGQQLAGIELMCQVLESRLAKKTSPDAAAAGEIGRHVREAIQQTRLLARGLSPVEMDSAGLGSALEQLATQVTQVFGVQCETNFDGEVLVGDNTAATHLFRIAQEAVNNAIKHGKAGRINISLRDCGEHRELTVRSDGVAFPGAGIQGSGMGLRIMQYRAGEIGAQLWIKADGKSGTVVSCRFSAEL